MSSEDRGRIADQLYLDRGASDAAHRADVNLQLGTFDLAATVADTLGLEPGGRLVDVGCGSGQILSRLAERVAPNGEVMGFDISDEAVSSVRERGLRAEVADATIRLRALAARIPPHEWQPVVVEAGHALMGLVAPLDECVDAAQRINSLYENL